MAAIVWAEDAMAQRIDAMKQIKKPRYRIDSRVSLILVVGREGFEPTTNGLKVLINSSLGVLDHH